MNLELSNKIIMQLKANIARKTAIVEAILNNRLLEEIEDQNLINEVITHLQLITKYENSIRKLTEIQSSYTSSEEKLSKKDGRKGGDLARPSSFEKTDDTPDQKIKNSTPRDPHEVRKSIEQSAPVQKNLKKEASRNSGAKKKQKPRK